MKAFWSCMLLLSVPMLAQAQGPKSAKPNILVMVADDLGSPAGSHSTWRAESWRSRTGASALPGRPARPSTPPHPALGSAHAGALAAGGAGVHGGRQGLSTPDKNPPLIAWTPPGPAPIPAARRPDADTAQSRNCTRRRHRTRRRLRPRAARSGAVPMSRSCMTNHHDSSKSA
jgi:hypothetical protein